MGLFSKDKDVNEDGRTLKDYIENKKGNIMEEYCVNFVFHAATPQEVILQCLIDDFAEGSPESDLKQRRLNLFNERVNKVACCHTKHNEC
jgi:hypothetical protein